MGASLKILTKGDGPVRVVIADDHAIVRQGVRSILEQLIETHAIEEATNGLEAVAAVKTHQPDLLVLDAAMPMARGIEVLADARRWSPETRVVLLTGFTASGILSEWLEADVEGILLKSCQPEEMEKAFYTVLSGGRYITEDARAMLLDIQNATPLSLREREVLSLIVTGNQNEEIAERLFISKRTVEKHRASLMSKLNVKTVAELMAEAYKRGLLEELKQL
ncbi:MAG: DNA-binding response regulator [Ponticaulis sp.]|nr:DNA-binding response regulator [Ponticaulis sp.]